MRGRLARGLRTQWLVCAIGVVVLTGLAVAGCGLPVDNQARPVASGDMPAGLLGSTTTIDTAANGAGGPTRTLYFLDEGATHLVPVQRTLSDFSTASLLDAVIAGPDASADPHNLRSDIPPATQVLELSQEGDTLTVVLSQEIINITGSAQANAFAQMVWTVTGIPGTTRVQFFYQDADGKRHEVKPPTDAGSDKLVLSRKDYQRIAPPSTTTTTTSTTTTTVAPPGSDGPLITIN